LSSSSSQRHPSLPRLPGTGPESDGWGNRRERTGGLPRTPGWFQARGGFANKPPPTEDGPSERLRAWPRQSPGAEPLRRNPQFLREPHPALSSEPAIPGPTGPHGAEPGPLLETAGSRTSTHPTANKMAWWDPSRVAP